MTQGNSRETERKLLLDALFWDSYPGRSLNENQLFSIGRALGSDYCMSFNENGYTDKFEGFDPKKVRSEVYERLTEEKLVQYVRKYSDKLRIFRDFYGQFYTFRMKDRQLILSSRWKEIEKKLTDFLRRYGTNGRAVLEAIYEVNFEHGLAFKNYYPVLTLAKNKGLGKGWRDILSELQLMDIVGSDSRHIAISAEMKPLIEKVLGR